MSDSEIAIQLKKSDSIDKVIAIVAILVFITSTYLIIDDRILFDNNSISRKGDLEKIAALSTVYKDVRVKLDYDISWYQAQNKDNLVENEYVFTGDDSVAQIHFDDGSEFVLEPNSLVIITSKSVDVKKGSLSGILGTRINLEFTQKGKKVKVSGKKTKLNLNLINEKSSKIDVISGSAEVESQGVTKNVEKNQSLKVVKNQIEEVKNIGIDLISPLENQDIWSASSAQILFKWNVEKIIEGMEFNVQISKDRSFRRLVKEQKSNIREVSLSIPSGISYFWRVQIIVDEGVVGESIPRRFNAKSIDIPKTIFPEKDKIYTIPGKKDEKILTKFRWSSITKAEKYLVQISEKEDFSNILVEQDVFLPSFNSKLAYGDYFWRVKSFYPNNVETKWTEASSFSIYANFVDPITLLYPQDQFDFTIGETFPDISLKWQKQNKSSEYLIEYSLDNTMKDKTSIKTKLDNLPLQNLKVGTYFWRVTGLDSKGRKGGEGEVFRFNIKISPIIKLDQDYKKDILDYVAKEGEFKLPLKWSKRSYVDSYRVEYAKESDFTDSKFLVSKNANVLAPVFLNGPMFWRVQALDKDQLPMTEYSETYSVEPFNVVDVPKVKLSNPQHKKEFGKQEKLNIAFEWNKINVAKKYRIEIAKDNDFSSIIEKSEVEDSNSRFDLPADKYPKLYWRVTSVFEGDQVGTPSNTREIVFTLGVPSGLEIVDFVYQDKKSFSPVHFEWQKVPYATSYKLQAASDKRFKKIVKEITTQKEEAYITDPKLVGKTFFWRVKTISDKEESNWSNPEEEFIISVQK
ncbi:MAG: hypothetical protein H6622_16795 [Halobacteriovoraceae bacterium]|nr:hypothetical protein [Halobacteriovoraceae bacterium]